MLTMVFEAIVPPEAEAQGEKEWLAMLLEENGCGTFAVLRYAKQPSR